MIGSATLGGGTWISANAPTSLTNNLGNWDAQNNSPLIESGIGTAGDWYTVSVENSIERTIDGISTWKVGDYIWFDGSTNTWQRINNQGVTSLSIGGSTGSIQYNNNGALAGTSEFLYNGENIRLGGTVTYNWSTSRKAIDIGTQGTLFSSAGATHLGHNYYVNTSNLNVYKVNGFSARYYTLAADGSHHFQTAPSGIAGDPITFTDAMVISNSGNVGIGTDVNSGYRTYSYLDNTDTSKINLGSYSKFNITDDLTINNTGTFNFVYPDIATTKTNAGYIRGISSAVYRNGLASNTDDGTLTNAYGIYNVYGHFDVVPTNSPTTTNFYGMYLFPFARTGTITNLYDLYIASKSTGGTVTNHWGIYQAGTSALNYFGGNVGIGTNTPDVALDVNGYTQLGGDAPKVKMKRISGTTASTQGGISSVVHGVTGSKIISFTLKIFIAGSVGIDANHSEAGYVAKIYHDVSQFTVGNTASSSINILSVPFQIVFWYEE